MTGIILTGHGDFASGLTSSAEWFTGTIHHFVPVDFHISWAPEILEDHLKAAIDSINDCDSIIILCDLVGGIPFQLSARIGYPKGNIEVVGGANLGMFIDTVVMRDEGLSIHELADRAVLKGQQQIARFEYKADEIEEI